MCICIHTYITNICIYIYIYVYPALPTTEYVRDAQGEPLVSLRSVFKISCLFLQPRLAI